MTQYVEFDFSNLKSKIKEVFGSQERLAEELGISNVALSRKLNNKVNFSMSDVIHICIALDIPKDEIYLYFYVLKA